MPNVCNRHSKGRLCTWVLCAMAMFSPQLHAQCADIRLHQRIDYSQLWSDFTVLASDEMQGRKTASEGSQKARDYLIERFQQLQLRTFSRYQGYQQPFTLHGLFSDTRAVNLVGWYKGHTYPEQFIVVSAHYDHLGKQMGKVFNGADDNASGVAGLLSLARSLQQNPTAHSVIFLATDAEEKGLYGARAFTDALPVKAEQIRFNLNLDMISRGGRKNRLYVLGASRHQVFDELVEFAVKHAGLCLNSRQRARYFRHSGRLEALDWHRASDHYEFDKIGVPYLYVGVETHGDYHTEDDTVEQVNQRFYSAAVETSLIILRQMDKLPQP